MSSQKGLISSKGGALWSSNGYVATGREERERGRIITDEKVRLTRWCGERKTLIWQGLNLSTKLLIGITHLSDDLHYQIRRCYNSRHAGYVAIFTCTYYLLYMCIFTAVSPTYFSGGTFQDRMISLNICRGKIHCVSTRMQCVMLLRITSTLQWNIECMSVQNARSMVHHVRKGNKLAVAGDWTQSPWLELLGWWLHGGHTSCSSQCTHSSSQ